MTGIVLYKHGYGTLHGSEWQFSDFIHAGAARKCFLITSFHAVTVCVYLVS